MTEPWIDLGPLEELPEGEPALRKAPDGRRFACVRDGSTAHVIDDLCPHQGYPLSQGAVRDGVLTCAWHNWKFELCSGDCTFGGDAVRRYPVRIDGGRVLVDGHVDPEAEARRVSRSLARALREVDPGTCMRDGLRLGLERAFGFVARDGARRAPWGFDHALATLADLVSWADLDLLERGPAFAVASTLVAEANANLGEREVPAADPDGPDDPGRVVDDLREERRADAEARVRHLVRARGADATVRDALVPFVGWHLLEYGHGAIYLAKALELARRFPEAAEDVLASATVALAWSTPETSLPPWAATRRALDAVDGLDRFGDGRVRGDRAAYEEAVLASERSAAQATVEQLRDGAAPHELLMASAHAAARRLARFDDTWERRLDAQVTVLDVTHALTFAESALALSEPAGPRVAARLAVQAAAFVGKIRRADAEQPIAPGARSASLEQALRARDPAAAVAAVDGLSRSSRSGAWPVVAPFAAFDAAVRPIRVAHTIKTTEAARRLDGADPSAGGAYLRAALAFVTPARPERLWPRRAFVATKFMEDGRPPRGLY